MPHLSPMSWMFIMPLMWMIILWLMMATLNLSSPQFYSSPMNKTLQSKNQWFWSLQGGRD